MFETNTLREFNHPRLGKVMANEEQIAGWEHEAPEKGAGHSGWGGIGTGLPSARHEGEPKRHEPTNPKHEGEPKRHEPTNPKDREWDNTPTHRPERETGQKEWEGGTPPKVPSQPAKPDPKPTK